VCVHVCVEKAPTLSRRPGTGSWGLFCAAPLAWKKKKKNKAKPAKRKRKSHSVEIPGTDCPEWWGLYTYEVETPHMSRRRPLKWGHMSSTAMSKG
jgi:hypothetical protein